MNRTRCAGAETAVRKEGNGGHGAHSMVRRMGIEQKSVSATEHRDTGLQLTSYILVMTIPNLSPALVYQGYTIIQSLAFSRDTPCTYLLPHCHQILSLLLLKNPTPMRRFPDNFKSTRPVGRWALTTMSWMPSSRIRLCPASVQGAGSGSSRRSRYRHTRKPL